MILKKLILNGFKSFCDKTEFEFGRGVTCIVGPNGCGKSNIVDAVKWVLGEQSAKALRGSQMFDMIFSGSSTRRSSGLAQVDLVFDNEDHTLNWETDEVVVSRRLYRSGESEYLLNLQACRRKDIRELFLDTGVGVDAYSVIEQGRVDVLLRSNPADRRVIFEEAAGISKYKARRKEAQRKLERTQQNLLRVGDIVEELDKRLRSVKLQAGRARRFREYDQRLRALRASYALAEYHRLREAENRIDVQILSHSADCAEHQAALARCEAQQGHLAAQALEFDREIDECNNTALSMKSQMTALQERVKLAQGHRTEQAEMLDRLDRRREQDEARIDKLRAGIDEQRAKLPQLQNKRDACERDIAKFTAEDQSLARTIAGCQGTLEDEKSGLIDLLHQSSRLHNEIAQFDLHRETLSNQKHRLEARGGEIHELTEQALCRKVEVAQQLTEVDQLLQQEQELLEQKRSAMRQLREAREQTGLRLARMMAERSGLMSQRELLQDLEHKMEGVEQPVRELLRQKAADPQNPRLAAIHGILADVITTQSEHTSVIEAALERWAQHLVVQDTETFLSLNGDLEMLKGRLHVLCVDRLGPIVDPPGFDGRDGYVCAAVELVKYPDELEYLTRSLLGRTIVVERFEHALAFANDAIAGYEFITLRGEMVDSEGRMTLGPKSANTDLIARKSRLREIAERLATVEAEHARLNDRATGQDAELERTEHAADELRAAIYESTSDRAEIQARLQHAQEEVSRLTNEQPTIAHEVEMIEREILAAMEKASKSKESLGQVEKQDDERQAETESYQRKIEQLTIERAGVNEALTEARVALGQFQEQEAALHNTICSLESTLGSARQSLDDLERQIADCQKRLTDSTETIREAAARLKVRVGEVAQCEADTLQLRHQRESLRAATEKLSERSRTLHAKVSEAEERVHTEKVKLREVVVRKDELCRRIRDELDIDLETAYETYDHNDQDWEALEAHIAELREKIKRLGNINLDAINEQQELEDRLNFLNTQRQDLEDSQQQMEELIQRLNSESRERFVRCFESIRVHFQQIFRKLFGGGKADLILDPTCDDILEAGIEILVRPPGKELQSITLLSGGEKALTAIALLLSIFKTKPSPFVILDEVDAALDEANNDRFNRIVTEFLEHSQFIIVTHSKRTMQVADDLYGVTMQEPGVSRRVSVRFDDHAQPESAVA